MLITQELNHIMRKFSCLILVLFGFFACKTNMEIVWNPTNESFYWNSENSESTYYLCYIDSEPEIINTIDSAVIDYFAYKFERNDVSNFEMLGFDVIPVEYFMGKKVYMICQSVYADLEQEMPSRESCLTRFDKVYILVDKNKKEDIKLKEILFKNYKDKGLIIVKCGYIMEAEGESKPMVSLQIYELGRNTTFDHLIRIE